MARITLRPADGESIEVGLQTRAEEDGSTAFVLEQSGTTVDGIARLDSRGEGTLHIGDRMLPFHTARVGDELHVWLAGDVYRLAVCQPERAGPAGAALLPPGGEVRAPMPGRILKVLVKEGESVLAGAPLVVMESMKMELTVAAPAAGRVAEVRAVPEAIVDLGGVLARLEMA